MTNSYEMFYKVVENEILGNVTRYRKALKLSGFVLRFIGH